MLLHASGKPRLTWLMRYRDQGSTKRTKAPNEHVTGVTVRHEGKPSGIGQLNPVGVDIGKNPTAANGGESSIGISRSKLDFVSGPLHELSEGRTSCQTSRFAAHNP